MDQRIEFKLPSPVEMERVCLQYTDKPDIVAKMNDAVLSCFYSQIMICSLIHPHEDEIEFSDF